VLFNFLKKYKKPIFWTFHDCWPFTGHCAHFTVEKCQKWLDGCYACNQKNKYPYSWFFDRSKGLYKKKKDLFTSLDELTIITPSQWLKGLVKQSFFKNYPVEVINNGIKLDVFKPTYGNIKKHYNINERKILLGVSSVWSYYKGLDVFCELYRRLDSTKYQIVLVGTDENVEKNLPDGIISIRRTTNQSELAELYTCADVFVNPTREDNYPTVNMEAIACGTPVVTFNTGGCAEIVTEQCGAVVYSNTVDEMVEKIYEVIGNRDFYINGCRSRANDFEEKKCFDKYVRTIIG
jgi:glycosyltransferase involved in cell wall biosynthesis